MIHNLANKTIIVTGGVHGIGNACVNAFTKLSANVISFDIMKKPNCSGVEYLSCDLRSHDEIKTCVDHVIKKYKRIDCVVNNAGIHPPAVNIEHYSSYEFNQLINLNLTSAYSLSSLCLGELRKTKGSIVNLSSMCGVVGQDQAVAYCASKAGIIGMTKGMGIEAGKSGVRVNSVSPSNVMTHGMREWLSSLGDPEAKLREIENIQILKRMAEPEEIANIVVFLASDLASFITGQNIEADGGANLGKTS